MLRSLVPNLSDDFNKLFLYNMIGLCMMNKRAYDRSTAHFKVTPTYD